LISNLQLTKNKLTLPRDCVLARYAVILCCLSVRLSQSRNG